MNFSLELAKLGQLKCEQLNGSQPFSMAVYIQARQY